MTPFQGSHLSPHSTQGCAPTSLTLGYYIFEPSALKFILLLDSTFNHTRNARPCNFTSGTRSVPASWSVPHSQH